MKKIFLFATVALFLACNSDKKESTDDKMASGVDSTTKKPPAEFADNKYVEMGKQHLAEFERGDIDSWLNVFSDNAVYNFSGGDSLAGKAAISEYWKKRRGGVIDSIKFTNDIWFPIKINISQTGHDAPGVWLLSWYQVNVKYKTGKALTFWTHTDFHYDANDKIDRAIQYLDFAPINKALGK